MGWPIARAALLCSALAIVSPIPVGAEEAGAGPSTAAQEKLNPLADVNGDGAVNLIDEAIVGKQFLRVCSGLDSDHDGVSDNDEINVYHTCPGLQAKFQSLPQCHVGGNLANPLIPDPADTDGDGLPDGLEIFTFHSDPLKPDTSGDFYTDGQKVALGKDPNNYCAIMAADVSMDGVVNLIDLALVGKAFLLSTGQPGFNARLDINRDGTINLIDKALVGKSFLHSIMECP